MTPVRPRAIEVSGLRKAFGEKTVLDGIDLAIADGTVFGLLGPNGAGKTTVVHILSTLLKPDAGTVRIAGHDLATEADAVRAAIGLTGQFSAVDAVLTGEENLLLMARLRHLGPRASRARVAELLERFDLVEIAKRPLASYSGGMRRRLDLAMTLVGDPRILFLDEPTTGLDPRSRRTMWDIVRGLVTEGTTVLLTTQYLEEADQLADRIAVLDGGRLVAEGTPSELKKQLSGGHVLLSFADAVALDRASAALPGSRPDATALSLRVSGRGADELRRVLDVLDGAGVAVADLQIHTPDLDDVFLALTGRPATAPEGAETPHEVSS